MHINLIGQINSSGIGNHFAHFSKAFSTLAGMGHRVRITNGRDISALGTMCYRRPLAPQASIFFWGGFGIYNEHLDALSGKKILWCVFENSTLPDAWLETWRRFDELWIPSEWGRAVLIAHGFDPAHVIVMPEGVDTGTFFPNPIAHEKFRFLMVGKYEGRKSVDETLGAFRQAFLPGDLSVELWLKCDYFGRPERTELLRSKVQDDPRIKLISGDFDAAGIAEIYNSVDAFVFPSKAEGFGLPGLEAMACGLPIMATFYSGQTQYLNDFPDAVLPIDYTLMPLSDPDYQSLYGTLYDGQSMGHWAVPDLSSIASGMIRLKDSIVDWREKARHVVGQLQLRYDWLSIARLGLGQIEKK